jgi:RNAse (barnase) inhibitor barstar
MATTKKITMKYWDSLPEDSRYRALRKVLSNFSDETNHQYAKEKAKDLDFVWDIIKRHVKQPIDSHYKTVIDHTWIP